MCITGGSSGIGLAVAERCARQGARVSIVARDRERLELARARIAGAAGAAGAVGAAVGTAVDVRSADVTDPVALGAAVDELTRALGAVDVLVTSAGYAQPGHFVELDDSAFRDQMDVNYFGALHAARAVVPGMMERRRGHLVFVGSTVAFFGVYGYSAYAPAKHALRGLAEVLRPELKPYGIRVACAYPPDTETPGFERENLEKPEVTKRISATITPRSAAVVGAAIVKGIEKDRRIITVDPMTAALARTSGLIAPVLEPILVDRHLPDDV